MTISTPSSTTKVARPLLLAMAALGSQLMLVVDDTVVNVALPHIQRDLEFTGGNLAWVVDMYMIVFGGLMLASGRIIDLLGRRRIVLAGLLGFGVTSLAAGLSQTPSQLVAARGTQGLFAAILGTAALPSCSRPSPTPWALKGPGAWAGITGISGVLG